MALHEDFIAMMKHSKSVGEYRDCTVKCMAITTGMDYANAHTAMFKAGRKPRKGATKPQQVKAMKNEGWNLEEVITDNNDWYFYDSGTDTIQEKFVQRYPRGAKGYKNVTTRHPEIFADTPGWKELRELSHRDDVAIFIWSRGHVSAYKNGKIIDWASTKSNRVTAIGIFKKG